MTTPNFKDDDIYEAFLVSTIVCDGIALVVASATLITVRTGPTFINKGLMLIMASCSLDIILKTCILACDEPTDVGQATLYLLAAVGMFLDVWVYWSFSYLYWVTSQNIDEYFNVRAKRESGRISGDLQGSAETAITM